ncbi:MAG: 50S ribosomal protein L18 [Spirochaetales bacterium]|nr:50S ribosomal protein L18 [Spirochaetales bacterium]
MKKLIEKARKRCQRKQHIRKTIKGTSELPRMSVFRSNKHMYVQVIDDIGGVTIAHVNTMEKEYNSLKNKVADAAKLGAAIGVRLKEKNISQVVFDRNGFKYHGIIKAIADGARESGIRI